MGLRVKVIGQGQGLQLWLSIERWLQRQWQSPARVGVKTRSVWPRLSI